MLALAMTFSVDDDVLQLLATGCALSIGAIGLNIVTGYAGQVSLGHAFFVAIGAYTAAVLSGDPEGRLLGFGSPRCLCGCWPPARMSALAGALVAPLASLRLARSCTWAASQLRSGRIDSMIRSMARWRRQSAGRAAHVAAYRSTVVTRVKLVSADAGTAGDLRLLGRNPRSAAHQAGLWRDTRRDIAAAVIPKPRSRPSGSPDSTAAVYAPIATKKAWPSDTWPA